jgi:hypothetical protein
MNPGKPCCGLSPVVSWGAGVLPSISTIFRLPAIWEMASLLVHLDMLAGASSLTSMSFLLLDLEPC